MRTPWNVLRLRRLVGEQQLTAPGPESSGAGKPKRRAVGNGNAHACPYCKMPVTSVLQHVAQTPGCRRKLLKMEAG